MVKLPHVTVRSLFTDLLYNWWRARSDHGAVLRREFGRSRPPPSCGNHPRSSSCGSGPFKRAAPPAAHWRNVHGPDEPTRDGRKRCWYPRANGSPPGEEVNATGPFFFGFSFPVLLDVFSRRLRITTFRDGGRHSGLKRISPPRWREPRLPRDGR